MIFVGRLGGQEGEMEKRKKAERKKEEKGRKEG
jgi:hypothetical protein